MHLKISFSLFLFLMLAECSRNHTPRNAAGLKKESIKSANNRVEFENLFNVYDPTFLSVVWPKITNGVHLLVELPCWEDISVFFKDLSEGRAWAYNVADASGRYQSALFSGNRFWLGTKDQCLRLDKEFTARENETFSSLHIGYGSAVFRREKYFDPGVVLERRPQILLRSYIGMISCYACIMLYIEVRDWRWIVQRDELVQKQEAADHRPPYRLAYTAVQVVLNLTKITMARSFDITLGVCLPKSCAPGDVQSIINFSIMINDNLKSNRTMPRIAKIKSLRQIEGYYNINNDIGAILLIIVTLVLVALAVAATLVEFDVFKCKPYNKQSQSFDLPKYNSNDSKYVDDVTKKQSIEVKNDQKVVDKANLNLDAVKKMIKSNTVPLPITLDVVSVDKMTGSCKRCGKYKRQCTNPKQTDNLPACPRIKYSSFASLSTDDRKNNFFCRLFLCFSLNYCWKRIFNKNTANKDLSIIHGMRILATFWIIFVHVAVIVAYTSENSDDINKHKSIYYILTTGTIAFDMLFFVSGLFSSHHFFYLKSRYSVEELVSFGGTCGQMLQFVCFVTNRVIRLLPSYVYAVMVSGVVARVSWSTSSLALLDSDHINCNNYWWRNLLYVTNIYPTREQCMQVSWYLSTETQLHMFGALACAASVSASMRARFVAGLAVATVLAATAADVSGAYVDFGSQFSNVYDAYSNIIERPWARVAPYFIGVFAGWLVHIMHGKLKVSKVTSSFLWVASFSVLIGTSSLPWVAHAWLSAWLHLAWPVALLWPVLNCTTIHAAFFRRLLDSSGSAAVSRLSYSMLVLHEAVARALLLGTDAALCSNAVCIWMYFAGTTMLTFLAGLLLCLLIEMPCCTLLRRLSDYATT